MIRSLLQIAAVTAWLPVAVCAQEKIVSVRFSTDPPGARYTVDGQLYSTPTTFFWPAGSKHVISATIPLFPAYPDSPPTYVPRSCPEDDQIAGIQFDDPCNARYTFSGWQENTGQLHPSTALTQTITADSTITHYIARFEAEYKVVFMMYGAPTENPTPPPSVCAAPGNSPSTGGRPGVAYIGGKCLWGSANLWTKAGKVTLNAFPFDGFVFTGFSYNGGPYQPSLSTIEVRQPMVLSARFEPGKRIRFFTSPYGLDLLIDRTRITTVPPNASPLNYPVPGRFDWANGSRHLLSAPSPQMDYRGQLWTFDSWDIGGGQNTTFVVKDVNVPAVITGKFVRAAGVNVFSSPAGLKISVDGRDNWPDNLFVWGLGTTHQVVAPAEQVDRNGRKYSFAGWSNGGPRAQEITVDEKALEESIRLIARYDVLSRAIIHGTHAGVLITVDGEECATPCTIDKPSGTELRISVPASIAVSSVERLEFAGWSDGAERVRTIRLGGTDMVNLTARYRPAFLLRLLADPADAADLTCQPALQENFYPADSLVTLHAEPKPGYRFRRWDGDITGSSQIATVPMSGARIVRALFDRVPYIAPAGVRNAAGETPEMSVAPGSVISIFGASLAPEYLAGPMAPLAQTLAGVTVRLGERFLPLLFVSSDQINAQLPSDMGEGEYKIAVRWSGNPEITAFVNINRNAPGLFTRTDGDVQVAAASLEDGSAVSASNPASEGSIVTLYGTGIGPYVNSVPDGFPTPSEVSYPHADTVELLDGDNPVEVVWSGAAAGLVGTTATRFKITQVMAANGVVRLRVRVNGKVSNEVSVPLR